MIAIFKTGGKQYSVQPGQILKVEKIEGKKGSNFIFDEILAISDNSTNIIGSPTIKGASIEATILDQIRGKKIIVFKKKKRKNYRSTNGHRQYLTVLRIKSIKSADNKVSKISEENSTKITKTSKKIQTNNNTKEKNIGKKPNTKKTIAKKPAKKQVKKKSVVKKTIKGKK